MSAGTEFLVGTASWTDPSLVNSDTFYPPSARTADARLKFYAAQFKTVEVDSSYYTLLAERTARLWVERTPAVFTFNLKAFALMTQHSADTARLPAAIKELLTPKERAATRLERPSPEVRELSFKMFWSALTPLKEAGKLGMVVFQFPPYFTCNKSNFDYLASLGQRMPGCSIAVEFRHPGWLTEGSRRDQTMKFLGENELYYVSVDAPELPSTIPSFLAASGPQAYVRFHGRNRENWHRRGIPVAERYMYLYSERELGQWAARLRGIRDLKRAYVIFNNCYRNFGIMNATTMAHMLT